MVAATPSGTTLIEPLLSSHLPCMSDAGRGRPTLSTTLKPRARSTATARRKFQKRHKVVPHACAFTGSVARRGRRGVDSPPRVGRARKARLARPRLQGDAGEPGNDVAPAVTALGNPRVVFRRALEARQPHGRRSRRPRGRHDRPAGTSEHEFTPVLIVLVVSVEHQSLLSPISEETRSDSENDGKDHEPVLVDQAVRLESVDELPAARS